jgi:phosphatidylserine/phosphatidylglycerophosphate/cardiolipin synthase-like enzyme
MPFSNARCCLRDYSRKIVSVLVLILVVTGIAIPRAEALTTKDVVMSEIAWMGTTVSTADEWIELYNNTANPISLVGWVLSSADGTPSIQLTGSIPAHGYYLLERTDDTTIPDVAADQIYTGALGNSGEQLLLKDASNAIQDQTATPWSAGDNTSKATMERVDTVAEGTLASSWANGSVAYGAGLGYGSPRDAASSPSQPPPVVQEDFMYELNFAGGLTASTVIDPNSHPSSASSLPMAQAMLARINSATTAIDFAIYGFRNQCAFKDALVAAKARGVVVRGFVDQESDGSYTYTDTNGCDTQALINALGTDGNGTPWVKFDLNSSTGKGYSYIMHNKFFVIDDSWVSTGSINYSDTGIGGEYNANWSLLIQSTNLANVYETEFNEMWGGLSHKTKSDNTLHVLPTYNDGTVVESYFAPTDDAMNHAIIPAIDSASTTLDVAIFYLTSTDIANAILSAKSRGTNVRVILDATGASSQYSQHPQLCAAGIPVKIENWNGKMHMKALLADGDNMIIGSQNFTGAGNDKNDENTLWIKGGAVSSTMGSDYLAYFNTLWNSIPDQFICNSPGSESLNVGNTCSDGIDNDYDGFIDAADPGCH